MLHVGRKKSSDLLWYLPVAVSNPHWDWTWTGKVYPSTWRHSKSICEARTKSTVMVFTSIKQNKAESWQKEDIDPPSLKEMGAPWILVRSQAQHREEVEDKIKGISAPNNMKYIWSTSCSSQLSLQILHFEAVGATWSGKQHIIFLPPRKHADIFSLKGAFWGILWCWKLPIWEEEITGERLQDSPNKLRANPAHCKLAGRWKSGSGRRAGLEVLQIYDKWCSNNSFLLRRKLFLL